MYAFSNFHKSDNNKLILNNLSTKNVHISTTWKILQKKEKIIGPESKSEIGRIAKKWFENWKNRITGNKIGFHSLA